jgi:hypothetical protein
VCKQKKDTCTYVHTYLSCWPSCGFMRATTDNAFVVTHRKAKGPKHSINEVFLIASRCNINLAVSRASLLDESTD